MEKVSIIARKPSDKLHDRKPDDFIIFFDEDGKALGMSLSNLRSLNESRFDRDPELFGERIFLHRHYPSFCFGDSFYDSKYGKVFRTMYIEFPKSRKPTEKQIEAIINSMKDFKAAGVGTTITPYFACSWIGDYGSDSMNVAGEQCWRVAKKLRETLDSYRYSPDKESLFFSIQEEM